MRNNDDIMNELGFKAAQKRVVPLMMMGLSTEEIAKELYMTVKGIKFQVTHIYKVTGLSSRARFMAGLVKCGWRMDNAVLVPAKYVQPQSSTNVPSLVVGARRW